MIDPRKTETAKIANQHLFIKLATDVYILLAILNEVLNTNEILCYKQLDIASEAVLVLKFAIENYISEAASSITGISSETIKILSNDLLTSKSSVVYGRIGVSVQAFGEICQWLINCINIFTGNMDSEDGVMFPQSAFDLLGRAKKGENYFNRYQFAVRKLPEFDGELPVSAMAEDILAGGIKAL